MLPFPSTFLPSPPIFFLSSFRLPYYTTFSLSLVLTPVFSQFPFPCPLPSLSHFSFPTKIIPNLQKCACLQAKYSIIIKLSSLLSFRPLSLFCCMLPTFLFLSLLHSNSLKLRLGISFSLFHSLLCSLFSLLCFRDACFNTIHVPYPFTLLTSLSSSPFFLCLVSFDVLPSSFISFLPFFLLFPPISFPISRLAIHQTVFSCQTCLVQYLSLP